MSMQPFLMQIYIYADSQDEVNSCQKAIHQFIEDNRLEGRAVTAKKVAEAMPRWKENGLVKMGIVNFLNRK